MRDSVKGRKRGVAKNKCAEFIAEYDKLIEIGLRLNPGIKKKTKARCFLERFVKYKSSVLLFLHNVRVPFTNNESERPIRMLKVEMKISGTFKTLATAQRSLLLRSYLLTCKNHAIEPTDALKKLVMGKVISFR